METCAFDHAPGGRADMWLYTGVANAAALLERIVAGHLSIAAVNASLLPCRFVADVAAWKACADGAAGALMTRNVHSELVYNLSPDTAITRSLRTFGMGPASTAILFVLVNGDDSQRADVERSVHGTLCNTGIDGALARLFDSQAAMQAYEVTAEEIAVNGWRSAIVNRVSCKANRKSEKL